MQQQLARYKYKFAKVFHLHQAFVVTVIVLLILLSAMLRISILGNVPIDVQYLNQKTSEIKTVKFNQEAINQIKSLNDSNVGTPGTQLPTNRLNPFNE